MRHFWWLKIPQRHLTPPAAVQGTLRDLWRSGLACRSYMNGLRPIHMTPWVMRKSRVRPSPVRSTYLWSAVSILIDFKGLVAPAHSFWTVDQVLVTEGHSKDSMELLDEDLDLRHQRCSDFWLWQGRGTGQDHTLALKMIQFLDSDCVNKSGPVMSNMMQRSVLWAGAHSNKNDTLNFTSLSEVSRVAPSSECPRTGKKRRTTDGRTNPSPYPSIYCRQLHRSTMNKEFLHSLWDQTILLQDIQRSDSRHCLWMPERRNHALLHVRYLSHHEFERLVIYDEYDTSTNLGNKRQLDDWNHDLLMIKARQSKR